MADVDEVLIGGRYRLRELIGQGGMGRVWRGLDEILGRDVAVKEVLLPQGITVEQRDVLLQRVMREARAAARLNHPGIITVHDVVEHAGAPVIVMEYVTGASLATAIARNGSLSVERVAEIGLAVLKALGRAHAAGIVHRDLKPDNVLLMDDRVILTDFGIAHMADATKALTHTGTIIGTPAYMAPEQLVGKPPAPATDLWALGATLYCAVEGVPPFSAETFTALCIAVATAEPRPPQRAGALAPVLAALLTKDPQHRADAARARAGLEAAAREGAGYPARPVPTQVDPRAAFGRNGPATAPASDGSAAPERARRANPGVVPARADPRADPGVAPASVGPAAPEGARRPAPAHVQRPAPAPRRARAGSAPDARTVSAAGTAVPAGRSRRATAAPPSPALLPAGTGMSRARARVLRLAGCYVLVLAVGLIPWPGTAHGLTLSGLVAVLVVACLNALPRPRLRPAPVWGFAVLLNLAVFFPWVSVGKDEFAGLLLSGAVSALVVATGSWLLWWRIRVRVV
ncbi:protein kinase [Streptomyces sp. NPDC058657]|uniref:protein kinase domain-containing protein n=1 Tax=unclassified Streptomyces TaxID=2593676 RepID=UPI00365E8689